MNKYFLQGKLKAQAGKRDALAALLLRAAQRVADIDGSILYSIGVDPDDPDTVYVTEIWETKASHDDSLKDEQVLALISEAMPLLEGRPGKGQELEILGGLGIPQ